MQRIQFDFTKKEIAPRPRSGSSPIRSGPQVLVTSPSKSRTRRLRGGSHGDVDFNKSISEILPDVDRLPDADEELLSSGLVSEAEKLHARITDRLRSSPNSSLPRDDGFGDDTGDDSDASTSLSSDFTETADSNPAVIGNSLSSALRRAQVPQSPAVLHALPPPIRPVSQVQPVSALTMLLKAKEREAANPMETYRLFSGQGELTPVTLKLYIPFSRSSSPFEVIINRLPKQQEGDRNRETTVAEAIGFTLYKYIEDKKEPALTEEQCDINRWTFRMVDDGEPDEDFPPLERTQPVTSYIVRRGGRGGRLGGKEMKLEGEFALVEATNEQCMLLIFIIHFIASLPLLTPQTSTTNAQPPMRTLPRNPSPLSRSPPFPPAPQQVPTSLRPKHLASTPLPPPPPPQKRAQQKSSASTSPPSTNSHSLSPSALHLTPSSERFSSRSAVRSISTNRSTYLGSPDTRTLSGHSSALWPRWGTALS